MTRIAPPGPAERVVPRADQESVWDYPRPPRLAPSSRLVRIAFDGTEIARSGRAIRVLETAGAPVWYLPPEDVRTDLLAPSARRSLCEWKGLAIYFDLRLGDRGAPDVAWCYPHPAPGYERIAGHLAFYASRVEATVDGERVRPQPGGFYGGWVTDDVVGPFKGEPGTEGW